MTFLLKKGNFWVMKQSCQRPQNTLPKSKYLLKRGVLPIKLQSHSNYFQGAQPLNAQNVSNPRRQLSLKRIRYKKKSQFPQKQNALQEIQQHKNTTQKLFQADSKSNIVKTRSLNSISTNPCLPNHWHLCLRNPSINYSSILTPERSNKKRIKISLNNIDSIFNRNRWWSRGLE